MRLSAWSADTASRTRRETPLLRSIVVWAVGLTLLYAGLYIRYGSGQVIGDTPWYIPTIHSFVGLSAFLVGFVALGRHRVLHEPAAFWIGAGFVAAGLQSIFLVLSWPGLLPHGDGVISRLPDTSAWIVLVLLTTLALFLTGSAFARWPDARTRAGQHQVWLVVGLVALTLLPCAALVTYQAEVPALIDPESAYRWYSVTGATFFAMVFAAGSVISTRRYLQTADPLQGYVSITQVVLAYVALSALLAGRRYDLWYYLGRIVLGAGFLTMLFGLLADYVGLFRRERDNTERLTARSAELEEVKQRLEEADRRKDDYLSMLSHELRNPLAAIATAVMVAGKQTKRQPDVTRVIEVAGRQVQHMTRLLDDLLDVARITRGRISLRREQFDIAQAVRSALEMVGPNIEARHHHMSVLLPSTPLLVFGDRVRLSQVVANLLDNAAKFTPNGGRITVSAARENNRVVVRVRDTGRGISADLLPHIFETFERGQVSLGGAEGGLGLGLALVRRLTELHGGQVQALDHGNGAEFVVRLPMSIAAAPPAPRSTERRVDARVRPRVLVVDDNRDAADMLAMWLEMEGYPVVCATSGRAALELAAQQPPGVVLLDLGMPEMDGYELARRLLAIPALRNVRIVAVSGYGEEEYRRLAREAGIVEHLVKPVDITALIEVIEARGDAPA